MYTLINQDDVTVSLVEDISFIDLKIGNNALLSIYKPNGYLQFHLQTLESLVKNKNIKIYELQNLKETLEKLIETEENKNVTKE